MPTPKKKRIEVILEHVLTITAYIAALATLLMMFLIVWEVGLRYVFHSPSKWISDFVTEFLIIHITMLPAAWILLQGGHVNVDLVVFLLGNKQRRFMNVITNSLGLIYSLVLTWQGWVHLWREFTHSTTFPTTSMLPVWPAVGAVFFGGLLLCFAFIMRIAGEIMANRGGNMQST